MRVVVSGWMVLQVAGGRGHIVGDVIGSMEEDFLASCTMGAGGAGIGEGVGTASFIVLMLVDAFLQLKLECRDNK